MAAQMIAEFGTRPRAFAVYLDPTFRGRPYTVGRVNSRGEIVERVANRSTETAALKEARRRADAAN